MNYEPTFTQTHLIAFCLAFIALAALTLYILVQKYYAPVPVLKAQVDPSCKAGLPRPHFTRDEYDDAYIELSQRIAVIELPKDGYNALRAVEAFQNKYLYSNIGEFQVRSDVHLLINLIEVKTVGEGSGIVQA